MADEKNRNPGYSEALIESVLQSITDPIERAEKKELFKAFGTTMLVLDRANLDVSEEVAPRVITEADIDAMVANIEDTHERERIKQATTSLYKTFGLFHG